MFAVLHGSFVVQQCFCRVSQSCATSKAAAIVVARAGVRCVYLLVFVHSNCWFLKLCLYQPSAVAATDLNHL